MDEEHVDFKAGAFHPSLPNRRAGGRLSLDREGVRFSSESATVTLPYAGLQLSSGGASARLYFLSHPDCPDWSVYTPDRDLLKGLRPHADGQLRSRIDKLASQKRFRWLTLAAALAVVAALPLGLFFNWNALTRFAASKVPVAWERQLGEAAIREYAAQRQLDCDGPPAQRLAELAGGLVASLDDTRYPIRFCVAADDAVNAFAVPGGTVVVQSGLIQAADSAPELLGVLAHELAHVTAQHGLRAMINSLGWLTVIQVLFGDVSGLAGALVAAAPFLIHLQYSQRFESEADAIAVRVLEESRVDPAGLISFFQTMRGRERQQGVEIPAFLRSHPATDQRIQAIRSEIGGSTSPFRDYSGAFAALKAVMQEN